MPLLLSLVAVLQLIEGLHYHFDVYMCVVVMDREREAVQRCFTL
jgi:hypothetical protein